jgi:hypothetical protein
MRHAHGGLAQDNPGVVQDINGSEERPDDEDDPAQHEQGTVALTAAPQVGGVGTDRDGQAEANEGGEEETGPPLGEEGGEEQVGLVATVGGQAIDREG